MRKKTEIILKCWTPVFVWMLAIFVLSSVPGAYISKARIFHFDKLAHFLEFFILGLLLIRASLSSYKVNPPTTIVLCIFIATIYAATDEWHQNFVYGRTAEFFDFFADFLGLNTGILLYKKKGPTDAGAEAV